MVFNQGSTVIHLIAFVRDLYAFFSNGAFHVLLHCSSVRALTDKQMDRRTGATNCIISVLRGS